MQCCSPGGAVYNTRWLHSKQFWLSSLLISRQASQLRYCLLEERGCIRQRQDNSSTLSADAYLRLAIAVSSSSASLPLAAVNREDICIVDCPASEKVLSMTFLSLKLMQYQQLNKSNALISNTTSQRHLPSNIYSIPFDSLILSWGTGWPSSFYNHLQLSFKSSR